MSSTITPRSNLAPSGKEEAFLRELLVKHANELISVEKTIESKQLELKQCNEDIHRLESALKTVRQALDTYQTHRDTLISAYQALTTYLVESVSPFHGIPSCKEIGSFLAADISSRHAICESEIDAVRITCEKLRQTINTLDEELRCKNISLLLTNMSLETSLSTRDGINKTVNVIKENFRAIKRIPVEIWLDILGAVVQAANEEWKVTRKDYDLLYPALRLAQVCESWRQIILDTPRFWTTISCGSTKVGNQEKRDNLIALLVTRARGHRLNIVDREHPNYSPSQWASCLPARLELLKTTISGYNYHIHLWDQYSSQYVGGNSWPSPLKATFEAHCVRADSCLSRTMVQHFKNVPHLTLINIPLREPHNVVSHTLTTLKIEFNLPVTGSTKPTCWIHSLLNRSLQNLELSQYASGTIIWKGTAIHLPNLRSLSITPHEHDLLRLLDTPSLTTLKISYPPGKLNHPLSKCITSFAAICARVNTLTLSWRKWGNPKTISIFTVLWDYAPKLQTMTFSNTKLSGEDLCGALKQSAEGGKRLTNLVIDGCVGVSRTECERLVSMVDRLSIYNSEASS